MIRPMPSHPRPHNPPTSEDQRISEPESKFQNGNPITLNLALKFSEV